MKILLVAMNAKYIHSNLAVYSLRAYAKSVCAALPHIEIAEYTINQQEDEVLQDIYRKKPDVLCISCYIWNITMAECIVREIKKICPDLPIWLGGPEVSYDAKDVLCRLPQLTGVMKGEGEQTFAALCDLYEKESLKKAAIELSLIAGITYREDARTIKENPWRQILELSEIPFVYEELELFDHKIIYYESSRGCPFSCSYCLSSVDKKLRFRDMSLVKQELQFFLKQKVAQVKFVDRTFNCSHTHALQIWSYIAEHDNGVTNFHFEISADLLDETEIELLKTMRPGLIQLEVGIQSTNPDTIREIRRSMKFEEVERAVTEIKNARNIHQHLDLIAGLPYEDLTSFKKSFDDVYRLSPEQLQLGFLKVLKGAFMEKRSREYGLIYKDKPPYEVLCTKWLSYGELLELKGVEEMVEIYYNSGQFDYTIKELEKEFCSTYELYRQLSVYLRQHTETGTKHKRSTKYEHLLGFVKEYAHQKEVRYRELLTYDYYLRENAKTRPEFAGEYLVEKSYLREFYEKESRQRNYLSGYEAYDSNQMRKMTHIEYFASMEKTILFDYLHKNPLNQEARTYMIEER